MREKIKRLTPKPLIEAYKKARFFIITMLFALFRLFKINKKKVVLSGVWGYGDNTAAVAEELVRINKTFSENEKLEICYTTKRPETVRNYAGRKIKGIRALKDNSLSAVFALATARVWVECNHKESYINKRSGQFYIQLWHGGIALKKIEKDVPGLGEKYLKASAKDNEMVDTYISNSTFCTQMYKRAFGAKCPIIEAGSPRNDFFIKDDRASKSYEKKRLKFLASKGLLSKQSLEKAEAIVKSTVKICVYAPTYRGNDSYDYLDLDFEGLKESLERRFGGSFVIALRLHPLVSEGRADEVRNICNKYPGIVINGDESGDLYHFLRFSDVLITDYSNTCFEFSMANLPVFLYVPDLSEYENSRGMYFEFKELPFPKAQRSDELLRCIDEYDEKKAARYIKEQKDFLEKCGLKESGHAAKATAELVLEKCRG